MLLAGVKVTLIILKFPYVFKSVQKSPSFLIIVLIFKKFKEFPLLNFRKKIVLEMDNYYAQEFKNKK